ncbi:hypothetical protein [uncultured Thiocystis sp.]|jgi:hypothetical protein|uniref:hypothetical protein n=1 Tax=uncultured Thiocystis sp. TaxID=1202134 RepID=UPI0025D9B04F|nr:hypothetical protein [uncultured Thiocystis sp.]
MMTTIRRAGLVPHTPGSEPANPLVGACAILALALLVSTYATLPGLTVFGHDEVHYYKDFTFKLSEDGRWLNYLLHDFLRSIPPGTWAVMLLVASWLLFFRLAVAAGFDTGYAALTTSTILLAYPFVEQSLWPATTIPAVVILLGAGILAERGVPHPFIYLLCGMLLFGTLQSFYFLVPLLFLGQFMTRQSTTTRRWSLLLGHMTWWVIGAVVGVFFMSFILLQMTGRFGVQPAAWRHTQPVRDLAGLLRNMVYVASAFYEQAAQLLRVSGADGRGFVAILALAALLRARTLFGLHPTLMVLAAVATGFFAFSIPLAPLIGSRNLVAMAAAFVLSIALLPGPSIAGLSVGALLLLAVSYGFSANGTALLARHKAETLYFYDKFRNLVPGQPDSYSAIALFGTISDGAQEARTFNQPSYMHAVAYALGAREYRDCRQEDSRCDGLTDGEPLATLPFSRGQLLFSVDSGNVAIIRYRE